MVFPVSAAPPCLFGKVHKECGTQCNENCVNIDGYADECSTVQCVDG